MQHTPVSFFNNLNIFYLPGRHINVQVYDVLVTPTNGHNIMMQPYTYTYNTM